MGEAEGHAGSSRPKLPLCVCVCPAVPKSPQIAPHGAEPQVLGRGLAQAAWPGSGGSSPSPTHPPRRVFCPVLRQKGRFSASPGQFAVTRGQGGGCGQCHQVEPLCQGPALAPWPPVSPRGPVSPADEGGDGPHWGLLSPPSLGAGAGGAVSGCRKWLWRVWGAGGSSGPGLCSCQSLQGVLEPPQLKMCPRSPENKEEGTGSPILGTGS